jgi:hypothetical protein
VNSTVEVVVTYQIIELLKESKDVFAWTYKNLKGIPLEIAQHQIKLNTTTPHVHQIRYQLNPIMLSLSNMIWTSYLMSILSN